MGALFDVSGLEQAARSLTIAGTASKSRAKAVVTKAALEIKTQMKEEARGAGPRVGPRIAATIDYDVKVDGGGIVAEIGPNEDISGSADLAFFYFGNSKIGPRIPDPMGALDAEIPNLKSYLSKLVDL